LRSGGIAYDAGVPPLEFNTYGNRKNARDFWASLLSKRTRAEFNRPELQTLRLREVEAGNRLTIDLGAQRLDLGSQASEVEREWLARLLAKYYRLPQVLPETAAGDNGLALRPSR
jgi:hypothetical protein